MGSFFVALSLGASLPVAAQTSTGLQSSAGSANAAINSAIQGHSGELLKETGSGEARERAMINAQRLSVLIRGVLTDLKPVMINNIATGKVKRYAPEQPVWIIDVATGTILYYQGQKDFEGKAAAQLVDDKGQRFGQKALENGQHLHDTWLSLSMGGQEYPAYCSVHAGTVVCSLGISNKL